MTVIRAQMLNTRSTIRVRWFEHPTAIVPDIPANLEEITRSAWEVGSIADLAALR